MLQDAGVMLYSTVPIVLCRSVSWRLSSHAFNAGASLQGLLFKYGPSSSHLAFQVNHSLKKHLLLVGGLTDGLLFAPYCHQLADAAAQHGYSLVQAQLTSSCQVQEQPQFVEQPLT
jgi:hypothetical protein